MNLPFEHARLPGDSHFGATAIAADLRGVREWAPLVHNSVRMRLALVGAAGATKGVDSTHSSGAAREAAHGLAVRYGCAVVVRGVVDYCLDPPWRHYFLTFCCATSMSR